MARMERKVSTLQWSRPETNVSTQATSRFTVRSLLRGSVVPRPSFFSGLVLNTLPAEPEFNAMVVVWSGKRSTRGSTRITGCDTAQTDCILDKTCDHSTPLESRLYQAMRMKTTQCTIHELTPFHPVCCCRLVSDVQSPLLLSPHIVHGSGATVDSQRSAAVRINPSMTHRDVQSTL